MLILKSMSVTHFIPQLVQTLFEKLAGIEGKDSNHLPLHSACLCDSRYSKMCAE